MRYFRNIVIAGSHRVAVNTCLENDINPFASNTYLITPHSPQRIHNLHMYHASDRVIWGWVDPLVDSQEMFDELHRRGFHQ